MSTVRFVELPALRATLAEIVAVSDVPVLEAKAAALMAQASEPSLWDNPEEAQKITTQLSATQAELKRLSDLAQRLADVETLHELALEADDDVTLREASAELQHIGGELAALEVRTLLSGEFDDH